MMLVVIAFMFVLSYVRH